MTFASETENFKSERNILIVITGARESKSNFTLDSGTTYTYTFPFQNISGIDVDGTSYTEVSSAPSTGQYLIDSNNQISINLGAAIASKNAIVVYYTLHYSDGLIECYKDPINSNTDLITYSPRIMNDPTLSYNLSNYLNGIVDVGSSSVTLANTDFEFNQYLSDSDSFYNKDIKIYYVLNGISNVNLVYVGLINSVSINYDVTISFRNILDRLNRSYLANTKLETSRYVNYATDGSSVTCTPIKEEQTITVPKLFGFSTSGEQLNSGTRIGSIEFLPLPDPSTMIRAVCMDYSFSNVVTNNREWGTILSIGGDEGTITNGVISSVDQSPSDYDIFEVTHTSPSGYYQIGDYVNINGNYVQVLSASNGISTHTIVTNNIAVTINVNDPITRYGIPVVVAKGVAQGGGGPVQISPEYYNIVKIGNVRVIQFHDGTGGTTAPETYYSGSFTNKIAPDYWEIYYRAYADSSQDYQHDDVIKDIVESAGLTTNASSFSTAAAALTKSFLMTAPFFSDFGKTSNIKNILIRCLTSVNGILRINSSNEVEYKLVSIGSSLYTLTDNDIIDGSFFVEVKYDDIITGIISENEHSKFGYVDNGYNKMQSSDLVNDYLHNTAKTEEIDDVLENRDFASSPLDDYLNIKKNRFAIYTFDLGNRLSLNVGDVVTLSLDGLLGSDTSKNVYIVSITKTINRINIKAIDLLGL